MDDILLNGAATAVLTYAAHSFAACGTALVAARLLRRPQDRDLLWKAALAAPPLTTSAALVVSSVAGRVPFVDLAEVARRAWHASLASLAQLPGREVTVRVMQSAAGREVVRRVVDPVTTVLSITALAVAACCTAIALVRFARRRRALARALESRHAVAHLEQLTLSVSDDLQSPVALGAGEICLPAAVLDEFAVAERKALIAHEMAHLARRDPAWLAFAEVAGALTAFQPLIFVVTRAFRRDVELICDEAALRGTGERRPLIAALARLAAPFDARAPICGAATAYDGSPLVERARRIATVPLGDAAVTTRRAALLAVAAFVVLLGAVPVVSAAMRASDIPIMPLEGALRMHAAGRMVTVDSSVVDHMRRTVVVVR